MTINTDSPFAQSGRRAEESNDVEKNVKRSTEVIFPMSAVEDLYHAAWALVLARHGDIEEVVYGYTAKSLGKNPVPVRLAVEHETESGVFLRRVKERLCNLSTGKMESLGGASTCTFDSVLSLSPNHEDSSDDQYDQFLQPLVLSGKISNQSTTIRAWFDEEAFSYSEVSILLSHFEEAVVQFTQLPASTNLRDISIFSKLDQKKIFSWNQHAPKAVNKTFAALFEEQARLRPSATAVCSWDKTLTYAELDVMSHKLAGKLIETFGPLGQAIPLLFEKSALAIVSMLAVLRAGGSFVHLGISNPTGRMRAIADACKATVILCSAAYRSAVELLDRNILVVDDKLVERLPLPSLPLPLIQPKDVALIQFTSGSTGTPKGIVLEHGGLATTCEAISAKTNISPQSRILQFSAYTFGMIT
jgi:non-ribosomal peptide synthetase component F